MQNTIFTNRKINTVVDFTSEKKIRIFDTNFSNFQAYKNTPKQVKFEGIKRQAVPNTKDTIKRYGTQYY